MASKRIKDLEQNLAINIMLDCRNDWVGSAGAEEEATLDDVLEGAALYLVRNGDMTQPSQRQIDALEWLELHARHEAGVSARKMIATAYLGDGWRLESGGSAGDVAVGVDGRRLYLDDGDWPAILTEEDGKD